MRIEIGGAQVTDSVVDVLESLQTHSDLKDIYVRTLDNVTRAMILMSPPDEEDESETLGTLRALQMIRRDIITLSTPPDVDNPENDIPSAQL